MPEDEKEKTKVAKKKSTKKTSRKKAAQEKEPEPSPQALERDQLESLREKLQRKYH